MTHPELDHLERESEQARARLVGSLARLHLKDQASGLKDRLSSRAKDAAQERADDAVSGIKARIAANPGAALAIGAGIAWRLYRHPPIATILIGAGLAALMRTDPGHPAPGAHMARRAVRLAGSARDSVQDWRAGSGEQSEDPAHSSMGQSGRSAGSAKEQIGAMVETARERVGEWSSEAGLAAGRQLQRAGRAADRMTMGGQRALSRAMPDVDGDKYLLGAAALALAAAVGIAGQRRAEQPRRRRRKRRSRS